MSISFRSSKTFYNGTRSSFRRASTTAVYGCPLQLSVLSGTAADSGCRSGAPVPASCQLRNFGSKHHGRMQNYIKELNERAHDKLREEGWERREKRKAKRHAKKHGDVPQGHNDNEEEMDLPEIDFEDESTSDQGDDEDYVELPDPEQFKARMTKVVDAVQESFKSIRGSEPTPELFESITVMAYGNNPTPLASLAQVVIAGPTEATLSCFDPSVAPAVRNAVRDTLELNPQLGEDGTVVVPMAKPTLESREKLVKQLGKQAEKARQRIRNIRRKANEVLKKGKEGKLEHISKDDAFKVAKAIDKVTEKVIEQLNIIVDKKQKSVMAV